MATGHGRVARGSALGAEDVQARGARRRIGVALMVALVAVAGLPLVTASPSAAAGECDAPANEIVAENCLPGTAASVWDVSGAGDSSIQGFATDISVDQGQTVQFKVDTPSPDYRLDIYRLGYYGGAGARLVATVQPSAALPQVQPACLETDGTTNDNLIDCGNWGVSASWSVPAGAASGIYIARRRVRTSAATSRATSPSSSATTTAAPICSSRRPTRPGRRTTSTGATASTEVPSVTPTR